jgi:hypothetical protein
MAETKENIVAVSEDANADLPKRNAVAAEPTHLKNDAEDLGAAVVKPTDSNPDATKKISKVSDKVSQSAQIGSEPSHLKNTTEETEKSDEKVVKEGELPAALQKAIDAKKEKEDAKEEMEADKKEKEIDVKEHVDALIAGENDLSEEFKSKAAVVFESAIKVKVKEIAEQLDADYKVKFEDETSKVKAELTEKVDSYLSYVVEEWMKENELALERGIKGEIAEDFIGGLKKLFEDHYIDVPDEKYNVLEDQASKIETLEKKLNEQIEKNVELNKANGELKRQDIINEMSSDLADTAKEKFGKLAEEVDYSNETDFTKKVKTIKESYFGVKTESKSELDDVAAGDNSDNRDLSNAMAAYSAAISKTKDIKLSIK